MRIIIVDDSKIVRESLVRLLSAIEGITTIEQIDNFKDVYGWIIKNDLSGAKSDAVILLDIGLPKGNGIDLIIKFTSMQSPPIVIMLTNHPAQQYKKRCLSAGADYYYDKTCEFDKVIMLIRNILKKSS